MSAQTAAPTPPTRTARLVRAATAYDSLALAEAETEDEAPEETPAEEETSSRTLPASARWAGPIGMEGERTGDGRLIEENALRWASDLADHPLPLRWVREDTGAHDGAVTVAGIDFIERREGGVIWGEGPWYFGTPEAAEAYWGVIDGRQTGVSMDLDDVTFELRVASDLLSDDDPETIGDAILASGGDDAGADMSGDAREYEPIFEYASDDELMVTTDGRVRAATIVGIPAFASARISILSTSDEDGTEVVDASADPELNAQIVAEQAERGLLAADALVASGIPVAPPAAWFADPQLTGPTPLVVEEDGRVYGHIATWDTCHTANPQGLGVCTTPPASRTGYARFHTGTLRTDDGQIISVGRVTMGTTHAGSRLSAVETTQHYEVTGRAAADVRAGEDAYGIWVAGALRPGVSAAKRRELRASPLSGDWRADPKAGGGLELRAVLAVNMAGFPIPRPQGLVASGALASLVASGMLAPERVIAPGQPGALSTSELGYLKRLAARERAAHQNELRTRVNRAKNLATVRAFAASRRTRPTR